MTSASAPADRLDRARAVHRRRIGALLRLAQRKAVADVGAALAPLDIGLAQIELLAAVAADPEADQRAIGAAIGVDRTSITILADAAEQRGWVTRRNATDRRRKLLDTTEPGRAILDRGVALLGAAADATLAPSGYTPAVWRDMLHRLAAPHGPLIDAPPALTDVPAFMIRRLGQAAGGLFARTAGADAMPGLDYAILLLLDEGLAETQSDLLLAISTFRSSTVPALRRLEAAGLIERATGVDDRRRRHLQATAAATARLRRLEAPIAEYEAAFLAPLSPAEIEQLHAGLARIADEVR